MSLRAKNRRLAKAKAKSERRKSQTITYDKGGETPPGAVEFEREKNEGVVSFFTYHADGALINQFKMLRVGLDAKMGYIHDNVRVMETIFMSHDRTSGFKTIKAPEVKQAMERYVAAGTDFIKVHDQFKDDLECEIYMTQPGEHEINDRLSRLQLYVSYEQKIKFLKLSRKISDAVFFLMEKEATVINHLRKLDPMPDELREYFGVQDCVNDPVLYFPSEDMSQEELEELRKEHQEARKRNILEKYGATDA